jgi:ubiquinone/menaquinone biosynthesis C-methylase UbiE
MSLYEDLVLPYCVELSCGMKALQPERSRISAELNGTLLEIGFGSGLNVPYYPAAVSQVLAVEPAERARKIARRKRLATSRCPVEFIGIDAQRVAAASASADSALSTFTLCTIPDAERALLEVKRILKPGGRLYFLEHGRAPDAGVRRWQDRLNGVQRAIAGGCTLNRDIPALLRSAGFELQGLEARYFPGIPRTHGYLYSGAAVAR